MSVSASVQSLKATRLPDTSNQAVCLCVELLPLVNAEPVGKFDGSSDLFRFNNDGQKKFNEEKKRRPMGVYVQIRT